jgi:hypothetical protein
MSTAKTQKLRNATAPVKRAKGSTSKASTANRDLFGHDGNTGSASAPATKRGRAEPATKRTTASRASTAQKPAKSAPRSVANTGSVRINFDLERVVHKRLKMLAVEADMTIADWMRQLIQKALEHIDKTERRGR